jgi:hypothetical protein
LIEKADFEVAQVSQGQSQRWTTMQRSCLLDRSHNWLVGLPQKQQKI